MMRSSVVLPEPLGPSSAKNSSCSIARSMRSTAVTGPKRLVTDCSASAALGTVTPAADQVRGSVDRPAARNGTQIASVDAHEASTSDQIRSHFSGEDGWSNMCSWLASALLFWK